MRLALFALVTLLPLAAQTSDELRVLVRKSLDGLNKEDGHREKYLFEAFNERIEFDAKGVTTSRFTDRWERVAIDGHILIRQLEWDGQPTDLKEVDEQLKVRAAELNAMPQSERDKLTRKRRDLDWLQEFPDALDYKLLRTEKRGDRETLVLALSPHPGYRARSMRARVFEKMNGTAWLDKQENELVRVEAKMFDDVTIGYGLFGRIAKGTEFALNRRRLDTGAWLVDEQKFRFDARIMVVKSLRREVKNRYDKFQLIPAERTQAAAARP